MTLGRLPTYPSTAYGPLAPRVASVKRSYPDTRGWGSGWPDCQPGKLVQTEGITRPRDGQSFNRPVRVELKALFEFLMQTTMDLGYEFRRNDEPDGGVSTYNCRAIKGSSPPRPSWHSWGMAIDINSAGNPQFRFRSTQPPWMVDLWESSGFYWGGRYKAGFEDAMHFEYCFRPLDVATDLTNAKAAAARIRKDLFPVPEVEPLLAFAVPTVPTIATVPTGVRLYADSKFVKSVWLIDPARDMPYMGEPVPGASLISYIDEAGQVFGKAYFAKTPELQNIRPAPDDQCAADLAEANAKIAAAQAALEDTQ